MVNRKTTMQIHTDTIEKLSQLKILERETLENVIIRLIRKNENEKRIITNSEERERKFFDLKNRQKIRVIIPQTIIDDLERYKKNDRRIE